MAVDTGIEVEVDMNHRKGKKRSKHEKKNDDSGILNEEAKDVAESTRDDKHRNKSKLDVMVNGEEVVRKDKKQKKKKEKDEEKEFDGGVTLEPMEEKKKKLKKDKGRKEKMGIGSSLVEIADGEELNGCTLGNNEMEGIFDDGVGVEGSVTKKKKNDKKKKEQKDTVDEENKITMVDAEGDVIKEKKKDKKIKKDKNGIEDESFAKEAEITPLDEQGDDINEKRKDKKREQKGTDDELFDKEKKIATIDAEGDVIKKKKKDKKKKRDKKGTEDESFAKETEISTEGDVVKEKKKDNETNNKGTVGASFTNETEIAKADAEGDAIKEKKTDKKRKKDKKVVDLESFKVRSSDEAFVKGTKSITVGEEGKVRKEKKRKRDKKHTNVESLEVESSDKAFVKEKQSITSNEQLTNQNDHIKGGSKIKLSHSKERETENKYKNGSEDVDKLIDSEKTSHSSSISKKRRRKDDEEGHDKKKANLVKDLREESVGVGEAQTNREEIASHVRNSETKGSSRRVKFSGNIEVFPLPDVTDAGEENQDGELVRGKWFSKEEDQKLKDAIFDYIKEKGLGEEGLHKVLHCKTAGGDIKNCWKEINAALHWRPREAIRHRAHTLFERDESHTWTLEEKEIMKKYHAKYGGRWAALANELGKNRVHMKDTWRRIKLPNLKRGHWSQEEYQTLFELVNKDLRVKIFEEKKTQHGMLRDNIAWEAISTKLSTRTNAQCCEKWYNQLVSPLVKEGQWDHVDDYRMMNMLLSIDASCEEDVDWDDLLDNRDGDVCRKRWKQMVRHLGEHGNRPFPDQVEVLAKRFDPELLEAREIFDSKVPVS